MNKKILVLTLAVVSAAFFALPASAQEIHLEPAEEFIITGLGGELRASGEPTITCTGTSGSGSFDAGSTTTGSVTLDFTGCHSEVFGFTASCKSEGSVVGGTIASGGTFHLVTLLGEVPGILLTTNTTKITYANISTITTSGSVSGTITSPFCGNESNSLTLSFTATGASQNHLGYTGKAYGLVSKTGSGENKASALVGTATARRWSEFNPGRLNCT